MVERGKELLSALEASCAGEFVQSLHGQIDRRGFLISAVPPGPRRRVRSPRRGALRSVRVTGDGGLEERCRRAGLNAVHGGENALRFTPWFDMSTEEVRLLADVVEEALLGGMRDHGRGRRG